ncbi:MAG: hypothetical protein JXA37_07570 [Chloroflexia bacterium]|nr:hypothetical protein [Chloroflexia bacterium]
MSKTKEVAQPTIEQVLEEFLEAQRERLKPRTLTRYEDIIELLQHSINGYAYTSLDEEESARYDALYDQGLEFCQIFGPDKILENVSEFLGYFMVRKVIASQELLKAAGTVTKKLARWLEEKGYAGAEEAAQSVETAAEAGRDLPRAERLSELLFALAQSDFPGEILEQVDDQFSIARVEPGRLWLEGCLSSAATIGPIAVSREISELAQEGWTVSMLLGRTRKGWRILEVGNVYPL